MGELEQGQQQSVRSYLEYRCYLTPEYWVITYRDADLIRVSRRTEHEPGFILAIVEVVFWLLVGVRTDLRDRWALWAAEYNADMRQLALQGKAGVNQVLELLWKRGSRRPAVKGDKEL